MDDFDMQVQVEERHGGYGYDPRQYLDDLPPIEQGDYPIGQ